LSLPRNQRISSFARALLLGLALLAFGPTLTSSFHFDDYALLSDPAVTSTSGWWQVFRLEQTRPLTYFTFWLNYRFSGEDPLGYHTLNLLIHLTACWLALLLFPRVLPSPHAALWAAAIFAVHPLQTEAVAYVFARATLLAALLCLLCWKAWIDGRRGLAVACFAAALLAKEEAAAFPLFLLGWEWALGQQRSAMNKRTLRPVAVMLALVVLAAARLFYAGLVTKGSGFAFDLGSITPGTYLLTQARSFWEYARLVAVPAGLNFDYDFALSTILDTPTLAAWIALAAAVAAAGLGLRKQPHLYWFLGGLLLLTPTSSVAPLADLIAERRMYLPLVSFSLFLGFLLDRALQRAPGAARRLAPLALAFVLTAVSFNRSQVWLSEESLWRDTAAKSPGKARPKLQLARALAEQGPAAKPERLALLQQAREIAPENPDAALEIGVFHLQTGTPADALAEFDRAAAAEPGNAQIQANRGAALYLLGRLPEAESAFQQALAIDSCNFDARNNLILLYRSLGDVEAVRRSAQVPADCRWTPQRRLMMEAARQ
jgi:tetratricopeptide (TPR) repeat protein